MRAPRVPSGVPRERRALVFGAGDVEAAVGQHREVEAGAGADLDGADAALGAVVVDQRAGAADLADVADEAEKVGAVPGAAEEGDHGYSSDTGRRPPVVVAWPMQATAAR